VSLLGADSRTCNKMQGRETSKVPA
jgi:hypothetical protein